jgi:transposase
MGKIKSVVLSEVERTALEKGARDGKTFAYRKRCSMILLKADGRTSQDVAKVVGGCEVVVNNWMKRYQEHGIEGLVMRAGRGRRSILQADSDLEVVRLCVQKHRQKVSLAKAELETELGKAFGILTLKRFLKKTVADTNALGG